MFVNRVFGKTVEAEGKCTWDDTDLEQQIQGASLEVDTPTQVSAAKAEEHLQRAVR
jgi:hypothetical protein